LAEKFEKLKEQTENKDQKLEEIYNILDKDIDKTNIQEYYSRVKPDFSNQEKLLDSSMKFLASAYYIKDKLDEIHAEDYSPYVLQFSRSIENELLNRIFLSFYEKIDSLDDTDTFLSKEFSNKKTSPFAKALSKRTEKFTLGTMQTILGFIWDPTGNTIQSSDLLRLFREHILNIIDENFFTKENSQKLREITQDFRNKAAHLEQISQEEIKHFNEISYDLLQKIINSLKSAI
jgi:hypothetical protein